MRPANGRRRRGRFIVAISAAATPVLLCLAAVALWYLLGGTPGVTRNVFDWISNREGSRWVITSSRADGDLLGRMVFDSLRVAWRDDEGREIELARAERATVSWRPRAVLERRVVIRTVELRHAKLWISRIPAIARTRKEGSGPAVAPILRAATLVGSDLVVREGASPLTLEGVDGRIRGDENGREWRLDLTEGEIVAGVTRLPLNAATVEAVLPPGRVQIPRFHLEAGTSVLEGDAELASDGGPGKATLVAAPLTFTDLAAVSGGVIPSRDGGVEGALQWEGSGPVQRASGVLSGSMDGVAFKIDSFALRSEYGTLTLDSLAGDIAGAPVRMNAALLAGSPREHRGAFAFTSLPLEPWLRSDGKPVPGSISGVLEWSGRGFKGGERQLDLTLHLKEGRMADVVLPSADISASLDPDGAVEASLVARREADLLEGRVSQAPDGTLDGRLLLALSRSSGRGLFDGVFGFRTFGGEGRLLGTLAGTRSHPQVHLGGEIAALRAGEVSADVATVDVRWDGNAEPGPLNVALDAVGVRSAGVTLHHVGLRLDGALDYATIRSLELSAKDISAQAEGVIERSDETSTITLRHIDARSGELLWRLGRPARMVIRPGTFHLESLELAAEDARITLAGSVVDGAIAARGQVESLELKRIGNLALFGGPVAGELSADVSFGGTTTNPEGAGSARLVSGVFRGLPVREAAIDVVFDEERLTLREGHLEGAGGDIAVSGWLPLRGGDAGDTDGAPEGEFRVVTRDLRLSALSPLSPIIARGDGRLDLDAVWHNPWGRPEGTFEAAIRNFTMGNHEVGDLVASGGLAASVLTIDEALITGGVNNGTVRISGQVPLGAAIPPGGDFRLVADIEKGDLALITLLTKPRDLSEASGAFSGHIEMTGTPTDRVLDGEVQVMGGKVTLPFLLSTFYDVDAAAVINANTFTISRVDGRQGEEGRVSLTGTATLTGPRFGVYDLMVRGRRYQPTLWKGISGFVNCDFIITPDTLATGRPVPHLEGEVNVDELLITRELSTAGHEGSPTAIEIALPPPTTTFDLRIRAPQKVRLQTRDARLELQGEVFASYDDDGLRLFGEVQTIRGYYWLYNHRFEVRRGIFTFRDVSDVENAGLDVLADTHIRGEKIEITLTGTLREPVVTATSESGWDETSIFRTLTFGGPGDTEESERGFTSGFVEAWRGALLDRIGARVAQDLGVDEIRLRADPGRGAEPQLEVGKRWADVYLSFRTAFGENSGTEALPSWELRDPERALSVEYRVSDRWSVDGEAGTLQGTEYVNVDLKFKLSY